MRCKQSKQIRFTRTPTWLRGLGVIPIAILFSVVGSGAFGPAKAAESCQDLPPSKFQILTAHADKVDVLDVMPGDVSKGPTLGDVISRHTMMLTGSNVIVAFDVTHRIIPQRGGRACDAPTLVRIAFGIRQRFALLAIPAANNDCVRAAMLAHEAAHNRAVNDTIESFVADHTSDFSRMVVSLKEMSAPNADISELRWEEGLKLVSNSAKKDLVAELKNTLSLVDSTSHIVALEDACGGLIRKLERRDG